MFKEIEVIDPQGALMNLDINPANVVFLSDVDLPSNVVGLDGEAKTNKGTAIALANGMVINSPLTKEETKEVFDG